MTTTNRSQARARLVFDAAELQYDFGEQHPMQPRRIAALMDLLETSGLWHKDATQLPLRPATIEELSAIHAPEYIAAVQRLSVPEAAETGEAEHQARMQLALQYGFEGDTPPQPGMHEVAARIAGGTLVALCAVMGHPDGGTFPDEQTRPLHVFHPAGGLHHAWKERASGFCVYNDAAVAIAHVLQALEAKVLYIDFDAHHGDGVQRLFYDDPCVMTISIHETGRYLFPGTGDVFELGQGSGRGYSINMPLEAFTEDDSYSEVMESLLPALVTSFAPDVIISQHGCDTHSWDPLTHLELTLRGIQKQIQLAHQLAHSYSSGRWVALGGGGYDLYRVVPRAWSMVWAEMSEQALPSALPNEWIARWRPVWLAGEEREQQAQVAMGKAPDPAIFPTTFTDRPQDFPAQPRRWSISQANRQTALMLRHLALPPAIRQAFPTPKQRLAPMSDLFDLLHPTGSAPASRTKTLETGEGPILLRDFCPPSLVERLKVDTGLCAFARTPEREHELLLNISKQPDCALTLAHTPAGVIIGQVTIAPGDEWWEGLDNIYEVAIEVSPNWRHHGLASDLLAFALELDALEDMILYALGVSWHWDTEGLKLSVHRYRELIARLFGSQGFVEYATTEPDISMEPGNIFMARIGKRVNQHDRERFLNHLQRASTRAGWP
jgi:acetoin utilization deacetylase AcuC-like enzyme/GNAT superfamily N-acetyltransferase